jgi:uncharacterized protein
MRKAIPAGLALLLGLSLVGAPAASLDCTARTLRQAQVAICQDAQLARSDDQTERRLTGLSRRLTFGQYLGLRYWHSGWKERREECRADRPCLAASYRAQGRFLDRLQQCIDTSPQRRACLRNTLNVEREAVRR